MSSDLPLSDPTSFSASQQSSALQSLPVLLPQSLIPNNSSTIGSSASASASSSLPLNDQQSLAIELLISGHVNSFVDFFYLTHKLPAAAANNGSAAGPTQPPSNTQISSLPPSELHEIRSNLMSAESSHRHGYSDPVYISYSNLAKYFQSRGDYRTAIYFYEKCLELAETIKNSQYLIEINLNLGSTHELMNEIYNSIKYFESALEISQRENDLNQQNIAGLRLIESYRIHAEEHEKRNEWDAAILFYKKCLQAAIACRESRNEALATYRLGIAYSQRGEKQLAIESHQRYLAICKQLGDQLGEGAACAALANCYKESGELKLSIANLEKYHVIAMKNKQLIAQAEACSALGAIYSTQLDHSTAVNYFERTFEIAKSINDRRLIDSARINLGMARGNLQMNKFMGIVKDNLPSLLNWKTKRTPLK